MENYRPLPDCVTIKESNIEGLGLFAKEFIPKHTDLGRSHIKDENGIWIRTPLGGFYNHSNTPNCFKYSDPKILNPKSYNLITSKDINPGEELTVMYTLYNPLEKT